MKKIVLIGSGGFAKEIYIYSKDIEDIKIVGYIDKIENENIDSFVPYLGNDDTNVGDDVLYILSIGNIEIRKRLAIKLGEENFYTFIHPSAIVASNSKIGKGTIVCPNCFIGPDTVIGNFGLLNYHTFFPHNCKIGDFCFLAPLTNIGGDTIIGDNFFSGVSTAIIPRVTIGNNVKVSAGTVITRNLPDNVIAFGNPCKIMRENK